MALQDFHAADARAPLSLSDLVRTRRSDILRSWEIQVRALPVAETLARPALIDDVPARPVILAGPGERAPEMANLQQRQRRSDRKSTRLNSSH